jgi:CobQ-like glutamine amidotransferase family enzyme
VNKFFTELDILWLWPDILNLHGDRANVIALEYVSRLYGIEAKIRRVSRLTDDFDPGAADMILLGSGELAVMPDIINALSKNYSGLKTYAESGGVLFATGTTGAALGVHTIRLDGSHIYGIGLFDIECTERKTIIGDDVVFRPEALDIGAATPVYGIQIQMIDLFLAKGQAPLGSIVYGHGNNGGGMEGAIRDGIVLTNASGPVLVKNPWLTLALIKKALFRKNPGMDPDILSFDPNKFEIELASAKAIQAFNDKKEKPR